MKSLEREPEPKSTHTIYDHNRTLLKFSFDRDKLSRWAEDMFQWLFCIHPRYADEEVFLTKELDLKMDLLRLIEQAQSPGLPSGHCVTAFFDRLPHIHQLLQNDLRTMYDSDPAATSVSEVLLAYPGFYAITVYRLAHELQAKKIPVIPRLLAEHAHCKTGIDIHPAATIGNRFLIDHGTGVVIGETCNIGDDVKIYQGVTLGALSVNRDQASAKRHPTIGDRVVIYANATILGGNTIIGNDSVIGGNVWITRSIPANSMVFHKSEIIVKNTSNSSEHLNFII